MPWRGFAHDGIIVFTILVAAAVADVAAGSAIAADCTRVIGVRTFFVLHRKDSNAPSVVITVQNERVFVIGQQRRKQAVQEGKNSRAHQQTHFPSHVFHFC